MSAFRRRTTFAAPVILSVAACSSAKDTPRPEPRPFSHTWQVELGADMTCRALGPASNPPAPPREIQCPPGMTGGRTMEVGQVDDGRCAVVPAGCREASCAKLTTPCPLPAGVKLAKKLAFVWVIEKRGL